METIKTVAMIIAAVVALLSVLTLHYFPWQALMKKELPRIPAYVLGVMAMAFPLTVLFLLFQVWTNTEVLVSLWLVIGAAGSGTILAHNLDSWIYHKTRADETEEREKALLNRSARGRS